MNRPRRIVYRSGLRRLAIAAAAVLLAGHCPAQVSRSATRWSTVQPGVVRAAGAAAPRSRGAAAPFPIHPAGAVTPAKPHPASYPSMKKPTGEGNGHATIGGAPHAAQNRARSASMIKAPRPKPQNPSKGNPNAKENPVH